LRVALAAPKAAHGRRERKVLFRAIAMRVLVALHGVRRRIGRRAVMVMRERRDGLRASVVSVRRGSLMVNALNVLHASSTANAPNVRHASSTVSAPNVRRASSTANALNAHHASSMANALNARRAVSQQVTVASEHLVAKVPVALRAVLRVTARRGALKARGPRVLPATKARAVRPLVHRVARVAQTTPAAPPPRALAAASTPARVENARETTNLESRVNVARLSARALAPAAAAPTSAARSTGRRATKAHVAPQPDAKGARPQVSAPRPSAASARSPRPSSVHTEIAPNARRARIVEREHLPHAGSAIGRRAQNIRTALPAPAGHAATTTPPPAAASPPNALVRRAPTSRRVPSAVKNPLRGRLPQIAAIATTPPARCACRS
jgi:hypothetical protein